MISSTNSATLSYRYNFCDIGLNLLDDMFRGKYRGNQKHPDDLNHVLERAKAHGVHRSIVTGTSLIDSIEALQFCRNHVGYDLFCTAGVHPTRCNEFHGKESEVIEKLSALIIDGQRDGRIVAIGECGLDYDRLQFCSKEQQLVGFNLQLDIAENFNLPLFLHNRNTNNDFIDIVRMNRHKLKRGGAVHSFDGSFEDMKSLIDMGLYIGINGCSLRTEESLNVVSQIPSEFLLVETDAPWCGIKPTHPSHQYIQTLFPTKKAEKYEVGYLVKDRNEPCTIVQVLEVLAAVRNEDPHTLSEQIYRNTCQLFFPNECDETSKLL
jgi:TatD DNase family protein